MNNLWRVTLLGGLQARRGDHAITRFKTQKVASLFAYLAYYLRHAHSREVLIEMLWPESDAPTLRNSLSVALSSLRNQFEPPGVPQGTVIRADRFSVGLNPASVASDVQEFETAIKRSATAESATERIQSLIESVELYAGPLLPGFYDDWISAEQQRLSGLFFDAVGALIGHLESVGDARSALSYARRAVATDPIREEGQTQLIRLLAQQGQHGAALRQFAEYERLLEAAFGDAPSEALRSLVRQIQKEPGIAAAAPAPPGDARAAAPTGPSSGPATVTLLAIEAVRATPRHDAILRAAFRRHGGRELRAADTGATVAFASAAAAIRCAVESHRELTEAESADFAVHMALHTGDIDLDSDAERSKRDALFLVNQMLASTRAQQILASESTAAVAPHPPDDVHLTDLGPFRFRGVAEPKRLYQLEYPGMARRDFEAPLAEAGHRANIPARFTRFFGRSVEIESLQALVANPDVRLVTVTGPAGNGKTRLSLEVADRLSQRGEDAVYWVALSDINDAALIAATVRDSLGVVRSPHREPLDQAVETLSAKPSLVVLDNFEHLVDGGAAWVQTLLTRTPTLKILVTSRRLLGLSGEHEFPLAPLPVPGKEEDAEQLSLYDSVQLFIDRAQQAMPHFQVSNANAAAVASLVAGLEGIPLAIELAAARIQVLTPSQMLSQISHRFDFLASRKRDVAERQRTLRGALEWSYRLLAPELQRFFCRLSVFRGGWTVEAAESVCEEPLALDYLEQLRECSLVLPADAMGDAGGDALRFRMLETLREYAQERLDERKESAPLRARHLSHFLALAQDANEKLQGPEQKAWMEALEQELENLRAGLAWSTSDGAGPDAVSSLRLVGALGRFWRLRGYFGEGRAWCANALRLAQPPASEPGVEPLKTQVLQWAGYLAFDQGDHTQAQSLFEESLEIGRRLGDKAIIAFSLDHLGLVPRVRGDYAQARSLFEESLALNREIGDRASQANNLNNLGLVANAQGDFAQARAFHHEGLQIRRELGDRAGMAASLNNLGLSAQAQGDYAQARILFEESLALKREIGNRAGLAGTLGNLAMVARAQGDTERARALHEESLAISRETGIRSAEAVSLSNLGLIALSEGDYAQARTLFENSLEIRRRLVDRRGIASSLVGLAGAICFQGDFAQARTLYEEALALNRAMGTRAVLADNLLALGALAQAQGDDEQARAYVDESLSIARDLSNRHGIGRSLATLGEIAVRAGDSVAAYTHLSEALQLLSDVGDRHAGVSALESFARLAHAEQDGERATRLFGAAEALRAAQNTPRPPLEREEMARQMAALEAALGGEAFDRFRASGRAMGWEEAVAYARR